MRTEGWGKRWVAVVLICFATARLQGQGIAVGFSESHYYARPFVALTVEVRLQSLLPVGLFSYGFLLSYPPASAAPVLASDILVPAELDFNGVEGAGAIRETGAGLVGVKGTVDFFATPPASYGGQMLARIQITPQRVGDYPLELSIFRTLGLTETVFVASDGTPLDPNLSFLSAALHVVPEPQAGLLLGGGAVWLGWRVARSRIRPAGRLAAGAIIEAPPTVERS